MRLTHTYNGIAYRIGTHEDSPRPKRERIAGAFSMERRGHMAILDNGETGEAHGRWLVFQTSRIRKAR